MEFLNPPQILKGLFGFLSLWGFSSKWGRKVFPPIIWWPIGNFYNFGDNSLFVDVELAFFFGI